MMSRISVLVDGHTVPLLSGQPINDSRFSPWNGLLVEQHHVGAIEVPTHSHSTFCLHMQTSGSVLTEWHSDGRDGRQRTHPGSLILLTPGTKDTIRWSGPTRRLIVSLDESMLLHAANELELPTRPAFENHWSLHDHQLRLLLSNIEREMESGWPMGKLHGDLLGASLSLALVRTYGNTPAPASAHGGLTKPRLNRVLDYIETHIRTPSQEQSHSTLRLDELAQVAGTSRYHFARLFRDAMGVPPHQYVLHQRIQHAKELLHTPGYNILDVATATGFPNPSHFSKNFRRIAGLSPTVWKSKSST